MGNPPLHRAAMLGRTFAAGRRAFTGSAAVATGLKFGGAGMALAGATGLALLGNEDRDADASDDALHAPAFPWSHNGFLSSYDHNSIRRGYEVYKNVCATCHSMNRLAYRNLVDICYTEEEVKSLIEEVDVEDGPNDEGEMFERPAKLSDYFPSPYKNEQEARYANGGALPPDLSCILKARHNGSDYIYALLTGYKEAPAGVVVKEGMHYNPYFPGGQIAMPKQLNDGGLDYNDGTPATESQMAKDVTIFLAWASEPDMDERKRIGLKFMIGMGIATAMCGYYKRLKWAPLKTRAISFRGY